MLDQIVKRVMKPDNFEDLTEVLDQISELSEELRLPDQQNHLSLILYVNLTNSI